MVLHRTEALPCTCVTRFVQDQWKVSCTVVLEASTAMVSSSVAYISCYWLAGQGR